MFLNSINTKNIKRFLTVFAVLFVVFVTSRHQVLAASLYFSPSAVSVVPGNIVSLRVMVDTSGRAINNVEGAVVYPSDLLEVVSLNKSSSIFSLWVEEPQFSNYAGKLTWNGGVPNPGYTGNSGEIVTVVFKAKKSGTASLVMTDAAIRENDGLGTDIYSAYKPGSVTITGADYYSPTPTVPAGAPAAPQVISTTHPASNKWYNNQNVSLSWDVPSDVVQVSTLFDKVSSSIPTSALAGDTKDKTYKGVEDGIWYFHIRLKNSKGWGAITHFKVQIDTVPPNPFKITFPAVTDAEDSVVLANFKTTDGQSGIDRYDVRVDDGSVIAVPAEKVATKPYRLSSLDPGAHTILVKALDLAGNQTIQTADFEVTSINPPKLVSYSKSVVVGSVFEVKGNTDPDTSVEVMLRDQLGKARTQTVDSTDGKFDLVWGKELPIGSYNLSARSINKVGSKSVYTEPVTIAVRKSTLDSVSGQVFGWISLIAIIVAALGGIIMLIIFFVERSKKMRRLLSKKIRATEASVHKAFGMMRDNIHEQIRTIEKAGSRRTLTNEEEKIIKNLQKCLSETERVLEKDLEDIDKIVNK